MVAAQADGIAPSRYPAAEVDTANERECVPGAPPEHPEFRKSIKDENAGVVI